MGFDAGRIRMLKNAFAMRDFPLGHFGLEDIEVTSNEPAWSGKLATMEDTCHFKPHCGWTGAIESQRRALTA
jgi:hypothetical protein